MRDSLQNSRPSSEKIKSNQREKKRGHLEALTRSHLIGDHPSGLTKEQTTETMDPSPKTKGLRLYPRQWNLELVGATRLPKKRGSVTCTDREDKVSKIFIISLLCVWRVRERFLFTQNGFKFPMHIESKTSQFEIVFMSLTLFNT